MNKEENKPNNSRFKLVEVPTQTAIMIQDSATEQTYDVMAALVKIMNDIEQLKGLL